MRAHQVALQMARSRHVGVWNQARIPSSVVSSALHAGTGWNAPVQRFQTRSYVFVPTSWEEWKRLFVSRSKRRTIMVKFFRDQSQAVSSQWTSAKKQFQSHMPQDGKLRLQRWVRAKQRRTQIRAESFATAISLKKKTQWVKQRVVSTKTTAMQWREQSQAMARRWREHGRVTARRWRDKMRQMYTRHIMSSSSFQPKTPLFQRHNSSTVTTATSSASIASAPSLVQTVTLTEYSQADWFDADGYPLTSRDGDRFVNPWMSESTNGVKSLQYVWNWRTQRLERIWRELGWKSFIPSIKLPWWKSSTLSSSSVIQHNNHNNNKYHPNSMGSVPRPLSSLLSTPPKRDRIRMTWIGHSTCLVEMAGVTILTDPIFSHRASPLQYLPAGVPRHTPAACTVDDLPSTIDICLISHDHYDHLDKNSVLELRQKVQLWVVPLGIKEWLKQSCQIPNERIVELEWWESVALYRNATPKSSNTASKRSSRSSSSSSSSSTYGSHQQQQLQVGGTFHWPHKAVVTPDLQITCAPTQHWSCRSMWDRNTRLWCSWALYDHTHNQKGGGGGVSSFYFGGDSGYPEEFPLFRQIGQRLGPFDLSALPIGAYEPSYFMKDAHVHPKEAVQIHRDILSKKSVGIHWGSFALAEEGNDEPPRLLLQETIRAKRASEPPIDFTVIGMGESIESVPNHSEPSVVELHDNDDDDDVYQPKASVGA